MSQELADAQAAIDARVAKELRIGHDEIVALIMEWNAMHPEAAVERYDEAAPFRLYQAKQEGQAWQFLFEAADEAEFVRLFTAFANGFSYGRGSVGRPGGQATSDAKAAAARRNGRKGGRPKKGEQ